MASKRGYETKVYRLTSGSRAAWPGTGAPSNLSEITIARDIKKNNERTELDASDRSSDFKQFLTGMIDAGAELQLKYVAADTHLIALRTAFYSGATVALAFLDGDKTTVGTHGLWADFAILSWNVDESLDSIVVVDISVKPGESSVPPAFVTVA